MGMILGSMIAAYLVCKLVELILLKWVIKNYSLMVLLSAATVGVLFVLAFKNNAQLRGSVSGSDETILGSQIIAVIALPILRIVWHQLRRPKKSGQAEAGTK